MTAGAVVREPEMLWRMAVIELDRDRGEIEDDALVQHGHVPVEHEWRFSWRTRGSFSVPWPDLIAPDTARRQVGLRARSIAALTLANLDVTHNLNEERDGG